MNICIEYRGLWRTGALDPLDMGLQAAMNCPRREWQMRFTAEPSLQPVMLHSYNIHQPFYSCHSYSKVYLHIG